MGLYDTPGDRLKSLMADCNEVLAEAAKANMIFQGVNCVGLHCSQALHVFDQDGDEFDIVEIEQASPDEHNLMAFVTDELSRRGWNNVEVRTGW